MIDPSWIQAATTVASAAAGRPDAPQNTASGANPYTESWLDGSGWTLATGGSTAKGGDRDQSAEMSPLVLAAGLVGLLIVAAAMKGMKS